MGSLLWCATLEGIHFFLARPASFVREQLQGEPNTTCELLGPNAALEF